MSHTKSQYDTVREYKSDFPDHDPDAWGAGEEDENPGEGPCPECDGSEQITVRDWREDSGWGSAPCPLCRNNFREDW